MGLCGSSIVLETVAEWDLLYQMISRRLKEKPEPTYPFTLVVVMDYAFFTYTDLKQPAEGYKMLEDALIEFHAVKEKEAQEDEKRPETPKGKGLSTPTKEESAHQAIVLLRLTRIVVRFLQRQAAIWAKELKEMKAKDGKMMFPPETTARLPDAVKNKESYAVVDAPLYGKPKEESDDDDDDDEKDKKTKEVKAPESPTAAAAAAGWKPAAKATPLLDFVDCFQVGDLDYWNIAATNPFALFFKLRYGVWLSKDNQWMKSVQVTDKALQLASEGYPKLTDQEAIDLKMVIDMTNRKRDHWEYYHAKAEKAAQKKKKK